MDAEQQFSGGRRYELVSRLGSGGAGVVYRARDRSSGREVALKTLRALGPDEILRLKREFRELRSVRHRNVIRLYELAEEDGHWFYTMELIRGLPLMSHVRPMGELDETRLRDVLRQLGGALEAVHRSGLVHCDVKPSNIIVEHQGRAVLVDPGISLPGTGSSNGDAFGTPEYMAPEQGEGEQATPAADWYALGCVLYEALEGEPPRIGSRLQILSEKAGSDLHVPPGGYPDLRELTARLLRAAPAQRPTTAEVLQALGAQPATDADSPMLGESFLGREAELKQLEEVWQSARAKLPSTLFVHGEAGIGKSALLDAFAATLQPARRVFRGRCDPSETVSFRAVDSLVDGLADYLATLESQDAAALLPPRTDLLARAFPVLRRVGSVLRHTPSYDASSSAGQPDSEVIERAKLADALGRLLAAIGAREGGVAVLLDDLDLADDDSVSLLTRVAAQPPGSRCLFVGVVRLTTTAAPWVQDIHDAAVEADARVEHLVLEALPTALARDLSQATPATGSRSRRRSAAMRAVTAEPVPGDPLAAVGGGARALGQLIAVAADPPLSSAILCQALGSDLASFDESLNELEDASLVRRSSLDRSGLLELQDNGVSKRILRGLHGADLRVLHRQLAGVVANEPGQAERAGQHFECAGDDKRAARAYRRAAKRSVKRLAFAAAQRLYGRALDHMEPSDPRRSEVLTLRGDCQQATGLLEGAADDYLEAALLAPPAGSLELKRCAADCLIRSGQLSRGLKVQREVFSTLGVSLPTTPGAALRSLILRRVRVRTRGLDFRPRAAKDVPVHLALKTDALLGAGLGMSMIDFVRGGDFHARGLLVALQSGDRHRIAKALIGEALYAAGQGDSIRCDSLLDRAQELTDELSDPYLRGYQTLTRGITLVLRGRWSSGLSDCEAGMELLRSHVVGVDWEINTTEHFARWALLYKGDFRELERRIHKQLHAAEIRGDRFASSLLRVGFGSTSWLASDQPERALEHCDRAANSWPGPPFIVQHWFELLARGNALLYQQHGTAAAELVDERWPQLRKSLLLRVESIRIEAWFLRARAELAADDNSATLANAQGWRRNLAREHLPWAHALSALLEAAIARKRDQPQRARKKARIAEAAFREQGAEFFAQIAKLGAAELEADDASRSAVQAWARRAGIARMDRLAYAFAPGLVASSSVDTEYTSSIVLAPVSTLQLPEHMTKSWMDRALLGLERDIADGASIGIVLDTRKMERFDAAARSRFINWCKSNRSSILRIGAVTDRAGRRIMLRAGGMIMNLPVRTFGRADECQAWVRSGD